MHVQNACQVVVIAVRTQFVMFVRVDFLKVQEYVKRVLKLLLDVKFVIQLQDAFFVLLAITYFLQLVVFPVEAQ